MRSGALVALALGAWCSLGACSGGYPLPPTPCDEYCNATLGEGCAEFYDPAGCVSSCEQNRAAPAECRTQLDAVIACYRQHPEIQQQLCSFSNDQGIPCTVEVAALFCCGHPEQFGCMPTL